MSATQGAPGKTRAKHANLVYLLAALGTIGPFTIDTYLPAMHDIAATFGASPLEVQQTLTSYLFMFSIMSLWHGAISDAIGRRKVIMAMFVLYILASLGCAFAPRIHDLWLLRGLQGFSACAGVVVSRAIVRDVFSGAQAQRLMSHIAMMFAIAPAVAPLIGGHLQNLFGWRSIFLFMFLLGVAVMAGCWKWLPETLPVERRRSLHPVHLARAYWKVLTSLRFLTACGGMTFGFAGYFLYIMSAPMFLMRHLGVSETGFLWLFGPGMLGLLAGSWWSGRLAGKLSPQRTILHGYRLIGIAVACNLVLNLAAPPSLPWAVLPLFLYNFGNSLIMPSLTLLALDHFPEQRGLAASCQMFLQSMCNVVLTGVIAPLAWGSALSLSIGMACLASISAACSWLYLGRGQKTEDRRQRTEG
ncbi:MAG: multidrug effflux MFS transporter [Zoogloeaceae bacterium]|jgi:DHA1 family bicyclomycin/chloramphenicol resistance-like MFS transporter|nr:multidrug effflux MFS transporter [Zoogloeaceae bacterium]